LGAISIKQLLEAGVHFGHQTGRWNPKMKPFIFGKRSGVHIIDLQKTLRLFKEAVDFVTNIAAQGKTVLFVGTKGQAQETVEEEARRCGMYWVNNRWLGGLLTNFPTVQKSIKRYRELESMRDNGFYEKLSKKEVARLERERKKLEKNLLGIKDIEQCPDVLFVVDSRQETIAVKEAAKLKIPIIAIVDTNSDPDSIDYIIPGNDDALRAIKLFAGTMADAILAGKALHTARVEAETKETDDKAAKEAAQRQAAKEAKEAVLKATRERDEAEGLATATAEEESGEVKETESEAVEPAVVVEEATDEGTAVPAREMKKEEKEEAPKKKKAPAKKAKGEAKKAKSTQAAKKTASKTRKTASAKSKSTKPRGKSKTPTKPDSEEPSADSSSSS
jgi:small subunit ribosomal protein S2